MYAKGKWWGEANGSCVEFFPRAGDRDGKYSSIQRFLDAEDARGGKCLRHLWRTHNILCEGPVFLSHLKLKMAKKGILQLYFF